MRGKKCYDVEHLVRIRPITLEDTDLIVTWRNRTHVVMNFIFREPFTADMHRNWMKNKVETGLVEQFIIEAYETLDSDKSIPVGSVYLRDVDYQSGQAEYGVFIGEEWALEKGFGSLAAKWAVAYAKEELGLKRLILRVFADNTVAVKSYEKAGFEREEVLLNYLTDAKGSRDLIMMKVDLTEG